MEDRILTLESKDDPEKQLFILRKNVQQFYDEYLKEFGDLSLKELRTKVDYLQGLFFNEYTAKQSKHF